MLFEKGVLFIYAVRTFAPLSRTWLFPVVWMQTSHFYVYCFNKSAYPYVEIPTVMSV